MVHQFLAAQVFTPAAIFHGSLVKRSRHRPLTPKTGVRFPYESPPDITAHKAIITYLQLVLFAMRVHLFPSRTQKLSSSAPKILGWRRPGKIGRCQHQYSSIAQPVEHVIRLRTGKELLRVHEKRFASLCKSYIFLNSSVGRACGC